MKVTPVGGSMLYFHRIAFFLKGGHRGESSFAVSMTDITKRYYVRNQRPMSILLLCCAWCFALVACGSPFTASPEKHSPAPHMISIPPNPVNVLVTLKEYRIVSSMTTFKPGVLYRFSIHNGGRKHHEFLLGVTYLIDYPVPPQEFAALYPIMVKDIAPGGTTTVDYTFPATDVGGDPLDMVSYFSNDDLLHGMKLAIVVKA